jgi:pyrroloquinoline quinone biosynthesis protein D
MSEAHPTENLPEKPRLNKLYRLQWEEAQKAYVLLYPEGMVQLNVSAAEILKRCDGEHSIKSIIEELENAFNETNLRDPIEGMLRAAFNNNWVV